MKITPNVVLFALLSASGLQAQNPPAPAAITPRLDTPQVRVIVATLQPQTPSIASTDTRRIACSSTSTKA